MSVRSTRPIVIPAPTPLPPLPTIPFALAAIPVLGAGIMWVVTGSMFALWFAALGPLMVAGTVVEGRWARRRARKRNSRERRDVLARAQREIDDAHERERARAYAAHPSAPQLVRAPSEVWRAVPGRGDVVVVGIGPTVSAVQIDDAGAGDTAELRKRGEKVIDMPITVPLESIAIIGSRVSAGALLRSIALQILAIHPPRALRLVHEWDEPWATLVPHATSTAPRTLWIGSAERDPGDAELSLVWSESEPAEPRAVLVRLRGVAHAEVDHGGATQSVEACPLSLGQAEDLAGRLAGRVDRAPDPEATFAELVSPHRGEGGLSAVFGTVRGEPVVVDLVRDGPHAIVTGVTGAGKSELLTTWVTALALHHGPERVSFLLVDFKGGRTFDPLDPLPHVTGVMTDLDEAAAVRAIESLRAEVLRRERVMADQGARDIDETEGMERLVVIVDEFAALAAARPELNELFSDLAARGRALGIHLILASQRATGVFREGLLANCPLRVSLRLTDPSDSMTVLGSRAAAELPGDRPGIALVRRAADARPVEVRVVRTSASDIAEVARRHPAEQRRCPWLPPLPTRLSLHEVSGPGIVLGVADHPDRQSQEEVALPANGVALVGKASSGKSSILAALAWQADEVRWPGQDLEAAWDLVSDAAATPPGTLVVLDDLDTLTARLPAEYHASFVERVEEVVRTASARDIRVAVSVQRVTGPSGRVIDLLPRAILAQNSRADVAAAGGEMSALGFEHPPARGVWQRSLVQFVTAHPPSPPSPVEPPEWSPSGAAAVIAFGGKSAEGVLSRLRERRTVVDVDTVTALRPGEIVWGSAEAWAAHYRLLTDTKATAEIAIDPRCGAELRGLLGYRSLPPLVAGTNRCWVYEDGELRRARWPEPLR